MKLLVMTAIALTAFSAWAQTDTPPRPAGTTINVSGQAIIQVRPDIAYVQLGVETDARTAAEATRQNAAIAQRIITAIRGQGIETKDLQTGQYNLFPLYEEPAPGRQPRQPRVTGYRVVNVVMVSIRDLGKVAPIIDAGLEAGANRVNSVSFGLENREAAVQQGLAQAVRSARLKAETMAAAADLRLGDVSQLNEQTGFDMPMPVANYMGRMDAGIGGAEATPVEAGSINVTVRVTIVYNAVKR